MQFKILFISSNTFLLFYVACKNQAATKIWSLGSLGVKEYIFKYPYT
jgi:hypothetical protein